MLPNTPYGVSKLAAMGACRVYREQYGVYAACGILFNQFQELRRFIQGKAESLQPLDGEQPL